ncbi:mitochondrial carrier homolog 2-like [Watersipora subatra]|uniref:mitochondrial carrier homolog 2-like n=1 Tax=Watersipora subatra TaxID=2589382 RepID=UPI00355BDB15
MASPDNEDVTGRRPSPSDVAAAGNEAKSFFSVAVAFVAQPVTVSRTLMQVGYEPVGPELGISLITRKSCLYYPNTFRYMYNLSSSDGITSLFTGFTAKAINVVLSRSAEFSAEKVVRSIAPYDVDADLPMHRKGIKATFYEIAVNCLYKSVGVVLSQPLNVVMVRMICSIADVNKNTAYHGFFSTIKEIYNEGGISGFFRGLLPRWFAEIGTIAMSGTIVYGVYRLVENAIEDETVIASPNYHAMVQFYVCGLVYKYQLTSTVMAASCKGLNIGLPLYDNWSSCFTHLQKTNQLRRGQSIFYREFLPVPDQ